MFYFCKNSGTIDLGHNCYLSSFEERKIWKHTEDK